MILSSWRWNLYVIIKNIHKPKAFLKFLFRPKFRRQILSLRRLLINRDLTAMVIRVNINDIYFSHDIVYPKTVLTLVERYKALDVEVPLIKVIRNEYNQLIVVDGNHRLAALKTLAKAWTSFDICVRLLQERYVYAVVPDGEELSNEYES